MVKEPIRSHVASIGDDAVRERTGRGREEWFTLLDSEGASTWDHRTIVRRLVEVHGVDGWWAQSLTVGYEQTRGMRAPGQRPDGTFEATVSRTLPLPVEEVYAWAAEPARRDRWLDGEPEVRGQNPPRTVRWLWPDGTRLVAHVTAVAEGRTRLSLQHRDLPDAEVAAGAKQRWAERLAVLHGLVATTDR